MNFYTPNSIWMYEAILHIVIVKVKSQPRLKKIHPVLDKPRKYKYGCRNIEHIIHLCYFGINLDLLDKCTYLKRNTQAVLISWNGQRGHRRSFHHGDLCRCVEIESVISTLPGKINEGKESFGWNHGKRAYSDSASLGFMVVEISSSSRWCLGQWHTPGEGAAGEDGVWTARHTCDPGSQKVEAGGSWVQI